MASRQAASCEQQDAISVSLVEPRGEASNRCNSARPQPLLPDQQPIDIDRSILNVYVMVDGARKALYDYIIALGDTNKRCSAWQQAYSEESQKRIACAEAYAELHAKYERTVNDLHAVSNQCLSLHRDLEDAQTTILAFESVQEQERSSDGKDTPDTGEGRGSSPLDWDMVVANEKLEARVRELEKEKSEMAQEYENALSVVRREANGPAKVKQQAKRRRKVNQDPEACSP